MVLHALGMFIAFHLRLAGIVPPGVEGTVRAVEDGRFLARVLVEAPDAHRWTLSDSLGHYSLTHLASGMHRLRFQVAGRVTLELTALVPPAATVRLDVELTQKPQELAPVIVVAPPSDLDSQTTAGPQRPDPLSSTWALRATGSGRDVESALVAAEGAMSPGAGGGAIHFQGGSSDHVLTAVDGFPVYGATHFGSAWSALNPDAVRDITLHSGAGSADGSRLSGTIDVRTSLLGGDSVHARGAVTPGDVRQLIRGELPGGGRFLLSARRSLRNFFIDGTALSEDNGYDDWLGSLGFRVGPGQLRILIYRAANQLAFESRSDASATDANVSGGAAGTPPLSPNSLEWISHTAGMAWDGRVGNQNLGIVAWRSGLGTSVQWMDPSSPLAITNRFVESGIRGRSTWRAGQGDLTAGLSVRRLSSRYDAHGLPGPSIQPPPAGLKISSDPTVLSASVRRRWYWGKAARLEAGVRANWASFRWGGTEPWVGFQVQPWRALTLSAQAGRAYQFTQSWVNEESFLSTLAGMEVPVVAGATGTPVARSDNLAARVELNTGAGWTLALEGYRRHLGDLLLFGPMSTQPFSSARFGIGSGRAAGMIARSSLIQGSLELALSVGLTRASRTLGAIGYTPAFARSGFLHAAALLHLGRATALGLAVTAGSGQPTTPLTAFDWEPYNPWSGNGELAGTPDNLGGPINSYRLSPLSRVDVGVRREWRFGQWPAGRAITTSLTIENLLNHANAIGLIGAQTARTEFLYAGSRALRLELGWAF